MIDLRKFYDRVYCINLDCRPDKWEEAQKEFDKWGLTGIERYSGLVGGDLDVTPEKDMLPGEIGISMTHVEIIKQAKADGLNNIMIMEDDVYFSEDILRIGEFISQVPEDWCFMYFGGMQIGGDKPTIITPDIIKINQTLMIHCIAINSEMFDTIINEVPKLKAQVDYEYIGLQKTCPSYCTNPYIAFQRAGISDIQNKYVDYNMFYR